MSDYSYRQRDTTLIELRCIRKAIKSVQNQTRTSICCGDLWTNEVVAESTLLDAGHIRKKKKKSQVIDLQILISMTETEGRGGSLGFLNSWMQIIFHHTITTTK